MKQTDLYYRAFREYREITARERENQNQRRSIASSGTELDRLDTVKSICNIDEEWVKEIEKGLVFVEKAIREERQFIRNDGEVVPIENPTLDPTQEESPVCFHLFFLFQRV